uniref:Uncharacterized protein n=1 Tax=Siphoviridae sp. ctmYS12 TaxID=2825652 RepID=A0A8S5P7G9_9CAUD|nr:MAG TPA: hypothetical protein [Siphoviridae sp. ctmYS12]
MECRNALIVAPIIYKPVDRNVSRLFYFIRIFL